MLTSSTAAADDVNVLVLGTNRVYPQYNDAKSFNVQSVANELRNILAADPKLGTVSVDFEPLETSNSYYGNLLTYRYHVQGYWYWQGAKVKGSGDATDRNDRRLPLLRGQTKKYDYVVINDDPAIMENFPGTYMQGVKAITEETSRGNATATPILLMSWPGSSSSSTVEHYKEVVYRVGRQLGCQVAPAALAWEKEGGSHAGFAHPSTEGAYLAAASIYSQIYRRSASSADYRSSSHVQADRVQTVVDDHRNTAYSGRYDNANNPHKIVFYRQRKWTLDTMTSKSTEGGIKSTIRDLMTSEWNNWQYGGTKATSHWRYPDMVKGQVSHYFIHPGNGGYHNNKVAYDTSDDTTTFAFYRMSQNRIKARHMPLSIMWMEVIKKHPDARYMTSGHISTPKHAFAAYQITQLTGRCPLPPKPDPVTVDWTCRRIGYELAWQQSTMQARAPGFKTVASSFKRFAVDPETPETMKSYFVLPPEDTVTVTVSVNQTWATVSPSQLTFTPGNYDQVQTVTVSVTNAAPRGEAFVVDYTTSSNDDVCDGLIEKWQYNVNRRPTTSNGVVVAMFNQDSIFDLKATDPDGAQSLSVTITQRPTGGTVKVSGLKATYTPFHDFSGPDSFAYSVSDGLTTSTEDGVVSINVIAPGSYGINLLFNPDAEYEFKGWTGDWYSYDKYNFVDQPPNGGSRSFRMNNQAKATAYQDIDISHYSTAINEGIQYFELEAWGIEKAGCTGAMELQFRGINGGVLGTPYYELTIGEGKWRKMGETLQVPVNAVSARLLLHGEKGDNKNQVYFDGLRFAALQPANRPPVAVDAPVADVAQNVPTVIMLAGSDPDRLPVDTLSYSIVDQPSKGSITGWDGVMPIYTPNTGYLGPDSFTFKANDGSLDSANVATANLVVRPNKPPTITFSRPTEAHVYFTLSSGMWVDANVTDDGGPINPGAVSISWEQLSGPETAVFDNPNGAKTAIRWAEPQSISTAGTYEFKITANDGELSTSEVITVTVTGNDLAAQNIAPQIDVNDSPTSGVVVESIGLKGADLRDPGAKPVVYRWQQISGLGVATFSDEYSLTSHVSFDFPSTYVLRLTGDDGIVTSYEDLVIEINGPPKVHSQALKVDPNSAGIPITLAAIADLPLKFSVTGQPANGALTGVEPILIYTPNPGFIGEDNFTFVASDGEYTSDEATVSIVVGQFSRPIADSYVKTGKEKNKNYGTSSELSIFSKWRMAFLKFDLSSVEGNVTGATLRLYATSSSTGQVAKIKLVSDNSWTETGIKGNNAPGASGSDVASFQVPANDYVDIDLTTAVQGELAGDKIMSLYLYTSSGDVLTFASRENNNVKWRPLMLFDLTTHDNDNQHQWEGDRKKEPDTVTEQGQEVVWESTGSLSFTLPVPTSREP